jgi:asparagine synthase (glutamine-hydrolysing)
MCGIAGWVGGELRGSAATSALTAMTHALRHRGPDGSGSWFDETGQVAFGHRRLSILDLSPLGSQPMLSESRRFAITYNGEIFNCRKLTEELRSLGHAFRGTSDTEVILAAFEEWGIERALERFVGMFAFALYDARDRRLHLVRDRLGIKPLYYGHIGNSVAFASELRAFAAHPQFEARIDDGSLALVLRYGFIPAPYSAYRGIWKLPPGSRLELPIDGKLSLPTPSVYWSLDHVVQHGEDKPFVGSFNDAVDAVDSLLDEAVHLRLLSDVPVGAFLSGGVDSATVVALARRHTTGPLHTFSIGSSDPQYDESEQAEMTARQLGTEHHALRIASSDVVPIVERLGSLSDEPFADSSLIPSFLVAKAARRHVTVALTGDGGDEMFAGYNRYLWGQRAWDMMRRVPSGVRRVAASALGGVRVSQWDALWEKSFRLLPDRFQFAVAGDKMRKLLRVAGARSSAELYEGLVTQWSDATTPALARPHITLGAHTNGSPSGFLREAMRLDGKYVLPDDMLTKVDRATMAVGLEARVPLLDHRLVELAWSLPAAYKLHDGVTKRVLRAVMARHIPNPVQGPKRGFGLPFHTLLRGPLRPWAESLLSDTSIRDSGLFDVGRVRSAWRQHLDGSVNLDGQLWAVLAVQSWLRLRGSAPSDNESVA